MHIQLKNLMHVTLEAILDVDYQMVEKLVNGKLIYQ